MKTRSTTILTVRHRGVVAMGGDGQVTVGSSIMKADAVKIRRLADGKVLTGFAGSAADAFALLERFEAKLKDFPSNMPRAATELAKDWRTDRVLRRLEAMMAVVDARNTLLLSGNGDVIQPTDGILGIGSGGSYAVAAAKALLAHSGLGAVEIVRKSLEIAAEIDIYTNNQIVVEDCRAKSDAAGNRRRTRPAHRGPGRRQAGGRRGHPQSLAPPATGRRHAARSRAEEHHDDRPDRRGQDGDRPAAGQADRRAVHQGRGDPLHRGRLLRPRRGEHGPRVGRKRHYPRPRGGTPPGRGRGQSPGPGAAGRSARAADRRAGG